MSDDALKPAPRESRWTRHARPTFLYVMYVMILCALPVGALAAFSPAVAAQATRGIAAYLAAIPDALWTLFGTGYLGYTAARQWGKARVGAIDPDIASQGKRC